MSPRNWHKPAADVVRTVFARNHRDELELLEDTEYVVDTIRNHRPEMRFRLVYDGPLRSSKGDHKTANVWAIRKELHSQLAELWRIKPALQGYAEAYAVEKGPDGAPFLKTTPKPGEKREKNRTRLHAPIEVKGQRYLPLVRKDLFLTCTLDILFLRKDHGGDDTPRGDLDNRIQTLFDGLKMPQKGDADVVPADLHLDPVYVLTEDDKLISSLAIRTDRLLHRPDSTDDSVVLIVDVIISPTRVQVELNSGFTWD